MHSLVLTSPTFHFYMIVVFIQSLGNISILCRVFIKISISCLLLQISNYNLHFSHGKFRVRRKISQICVFITSDVPLFLLMDCVACLALEHSSIGILSISVTFILLQLIMYIILHCENIPAPEYNSHPVFWRDV